MLCLLPGILLKWMRCWCLDAKGILALQSSLNRRYGPVHHHPYAIIHIDCLLWLEVYPIKTGKFWSNFQIFDWKQRRCLTNKMCPTFLQTLIDQFNSVGWGVLNVFFLVEIWLTFSKLNQTFFSIKRKCRITWPLSPWTRAPLLTGTATDPLPRLSSSCSQFKICGWRWSKISLSLAETQIMQINLC